MPVGEKDIVPGEYVVKHPTKPPDENEIYAIVVFGSVFEADTLANLTSGDSVLVLPGKPVEVRFRGVPWYTAGSPGKPARPHDGSWPAVTVSVTTVIGDTIQGRIPIKNFDWLAPVASEASVSAEIG